MGIFYFILTRWSRLKPFLSSVSAAGSLALAEFIQGHTGSTNTPVRSRRRPPPTSRRRRDLGLPDLRPPPPVCSRPPRPSPRRLRRSLPPAGPQARPRSSSVRRPAPCLRPLCLRPPRPRPPGERRLRTNVFIKGFRSNKQDSVTVN